MHTSQSHQLELLGEAANMLAKAKSFDDIKGIRNKAEAVRIYAKAAKLGLELQNQAAELKLCAERKAGKYLSALNLRGGDRRSKRHRATLKLEELGISKHESRRWQLAFTVPEKAFKKYIEGRNSLGEEITAAGLLRLARHLQHIACSDPKAHSLSEGNGHRTTDQLPVNGPISLIEELREHRGLLAQILQPLYMTNGQVSEPKLKPGECRALGHLLHEMEVVIGSLEREIVRLKLSGNAFYSSDNSETDFNNTTNYYPSGLTNIVDQFQDNSIKSLNYGGSMSLTQKIAGAVYMDAGVSASNAEQTMDRVQGDYLASESLIDSLSPEFLKINQSIKPSLSIRRNTDKMTFSAGVDYNLGRYNTTLDDDASNVIPYNFLQPRLTWQYRYKTGRRLGIRYSSKANTPSANQLLPVVNNFNTLSLFYGNRELTPEFIHSASVSWWIFDEFSFTTFLVGLRSTYTQNKINYSRSVNDQLVQELRLVNVEDDLSLSGNIDFSTPIRALGIKTNIDISESYNKGINIVNGLDNEITSFKHNYSLSFDNRKKDKWDINSGVGLSMTDARYSIQESLNNVYYDLSWFGEIRFTPSDKFDFFFSADVTNYTAQSFEESQLVPLLGAHISYFFLKNNRMTLTLAGHDLLNKNTGISRISEANFLQEKTSNIIGRYFMLTLKYRLNKFGGDTGMNVKMRKR